MRTDSIYRFVYTDMYAECQEWVYECRSPMTGKRKFSRGQSLVRREL